MNLRTLLSLLLIVLFFILIGGIHRSSNSSKNAVVTQKILSTPAPVVQSIDKNTVSSKEKFILYIREHPLKFGFMGGLLFVFLGVALTYFYFNRI